MFYRTLPPQLPLPKKVEKIGDDYPRHMKYEERNRVISLWSERGRQEMRRKLSCIIRQRHKEEEGVTGMTYLCIP